MRKEWPTRPWKRNRRHRRKKCPFILRCAEVVVLGSGLKRLERRLQKYELSFVMSADSRLGAVYDTLIAAVTLTLTKESV